MKCIFAVLLAAFRLGLASECRAGDTVFYHSYILSSTRDSAKLYRLAPESAGDSLVYTYRDLRHRKRLQWFSPNGDTVIREGRMVYYDTTGLVQEYGFLRRGMRTGVWTENFRGTPNRHTEATYAHDVRQGLYTSYDSVSGNVLLTGTFEENARTGLWRLYYRGTTALFAEQHYTADKLDGDLVSFYPDGRVRRREMFRQGKPETGSVYDRNGKKIKYVPFLTHAKPVGRELSWYLERNLQKLPAFKEDAPAPVGSIRLQFDVLPGGTLANLKVIDTWSPAIERAYRKAFSETQWEPAMLEGRPIFSTVRLSHAWGDGVATQKMSEFKDQYPPAPDFRF